MFPSVFFLHLFPSKAASIGSSTCNLICPIWLSVYVSLLFNLYLLFSIISFWLSFREVLQFMNTLALLYVNPLLSGYVTTKNVDSCQLHSNVMCSFTIIISSFAYQNLCLNCSSPGLWHWQGIISVESTFMRVYFQH